MKVNLIPSVFAIALSALMAYMCYEFSDNSFKNLYTIFAFVSTLLTLLFLLAVDYHNTRTTINIKAISFIELLVGLVLLFIFNSYDSNQKSFIIAMSFLLIIYLGIIYMINQMSTKQP